MMDFNWAVEQMKQGKKVIRGSAPKDYYIQIENDEFVGGVQKDTVMMEYDAIISTDWKLFEEHFDLSKKAILDVSINGEEVPCVYLESDIKESINQTKSIILDAENTRADMINKIEKLTGERFK